MIDAMQERLDRRPDAMRVRRATVEHAFGTLKAWMGATHFRTRTLDKVRTEMSLHVLAYNLKRVIAILGAGPADGGDAGLNKAVRPRQTGRLQYPNGHAAPIIRPGHDAASAFSHSLGQRRTYTTAA